MIPSALLNASVIVLFSNSWFISPVFFGRFCEIFHDDKSAVSGIYYVCKIDVIWCKHYVLS